jgi:hypothetical protein
LESPTCPNGSSGPSESYDEPVGHPNSSRSSSTTIKRKWSNVTFFSFKSFMCAAVTLDRPFSTMIIGRQILPPLKEKKVTFDHFLRSGLVEYLDVNEENDSFIACYVLQKLHVRRSDPRSTLLDDDHRSTDSSTIAGNVNRMKLLKEKKVTFDHFLRSGLVEYLDVNEENDSFIGPATAPRIVKGSISR